jgi:hypothetical protein
MYMKIIFINSKKDFFEIHTKNLICWFLNEVIVWNSSLIILWSIMKTEFKKNSSRENLRYKFPQIAQKEKENQKTFNILFILLFGHFEILKVKNIKNKKKSWSTKFLKCKNSKENLTVRSMKEMFFWKHWNGDERSSELVIQSESIKKSSNVTAHNHHQFLDVSTNL